MNRSGVVVVGSANMDMVVTTDRFPRPGETVFGGSFGMFPGGKGANQAVCCAKLGGKTYFIGKMGKDIFHEKLARSMENDGVLLDRLSTDETASTGVALITVDRSGQNEIVVVSGSNMKLHPGDIEREREIFLKVRVALLQLEIPIKTVVRTAQLARERAVTVVLNPAPARPLPKSLLKMVDYLTPNETETEILTGTPVKNTRMAEKAGRKLLAMGVRNVLITLGAKGCLLVNRETTKLFPAIKVKAVDTTAAGDAFNGALAFSLSSGKSLCEAIPFANSVAAYAVTKLGAQSSMPTMQELSAFID